MGGGMGGGMGMGMDRFVRPRIPEARAPQAARAPLILTTLYPTESDANRQELKWLLATLQDRFDPESNTLIGQGESGSKVYSLPSDRSTLAIKFNPRATSESQSELKAWSAIDARCRARHTLPLLGAFTNTMPSVGETQRRQMYLVSPRCEASLSSMIRQAERNPSGEAAATLGRALPRLVPDLVDALSCLKDAGYYHRDVKPDNIYYCDGQWNLGDFGVAITTDDYKLLTPGGFEWFAGTGELRPPFTPAEGDTDSLPPPFDYETDVYGLGVTLSKALKFFSPDERTKLIPIIARMLSEQSSDRPTLAELGK